MGGTGRLLNRQLNTCLFFKTTFSRACLRKEQETSIFQKRKGLRGKLFALNTKEKFPEGLLRGMTGPGVQDGGTCF
jgi:hypothetical protein